MRGQRIAEKAKKIRIIFPELLLLVLMAGIIFLMVYFNDIVTSVGLRELQTDLGSLNRTNSKRDFLSMVAKYKLQKRLYEEKINDDEFGLEELKINSIVGMKEKTGSEVAERYTNILPPVFFFINAIRFVMGEKPLSPASHDPAAAYLDIAYYYERNKQYKKALEVYRIATGLIPHGNKKIPVIQLHRGFCLSIIGDYENAREKYSDVIRENRDEEITKTARILLSFLNEIRAEVNRIKNSSAGPGEKGEKLFKLMAYGEAVKLLDQAKPGNRREADKNRYYKARSLEESGEAKKSVEIYQDIIKNNPRSDYAKASNRRILTMSAADQNNNELRRLADRNNKTIRDPRYSDFVKSIDELSGDGRNLSLEQILQNSPVNKQALDSVLQDNGGQEKEKRPLTAEDTAFNKQAIKKLEKIKKELEDKNAALLRANKRMKQQLDRLLFNTIPNNRIYNERTKVVTNIDQFGKIISKYTYKTDRSGYLYTYAYSIYYYSESNQLYKIIDYDGKNNMLAVYLIAYDDAGKQVEIRKYDAQGRLIYIK